MKKKLHSLAAIVVALMTYSAATGDAADVRIAHFAVDVTPPVQTPLCLGLVPRATGVDDRLTARGVIFLPEGQAPAVLVAVDWVGIANESHERWRTAIAKACGTAPDRVAVQTLHQHDAPGCDLGAEEHAATVGVGGELLDRDFSLNAIERVAEAAEQSLATAEPVTHLGYGLGPVKRVASNRRILGPDGKVAEQRMSSSGERLRDLPEGTIDPNARVVSFWNDNKPVLALTYYATHPQSYYRTGKASADFVGMARSAREAALPGVFHIHFNGASGNVAAGKYNDGTPPRRAELAERLAAGHERAWSNAERLPLRALDFDWKSLEVQMPLAGWLQRDELAQLLADKSASLIDRLQAARGLSFLDRSEAGMPIILSRLRIGPVDLLHLPGEPFVEYQLATQKLAPARFVCVAAYGDYGPGYVGLHRSYAEGGYETGRASRTAPQVETTLMGAIEELCR